MVVRWLSGQPASSHANQMDDTLSYAFWVGLTWWSMQDFCAVVTPTLELSISWFAACGFYLLCKIDYLISD